MKDGIIFFARNTIFIQFITVTVTVTGLQIWVKCWNSTQPGEEESVPDLSITEVGVPPSTESWTFLLLSYFKKAEVILSVKWSLGNPDHPRHFQHGRQHAIWEKSGYPDRPPSSTSSVESAIRHYTIQHPSSPHLITFTSPSPSFHTESSIGDFTAGKWRNIGWCSGDCSWMWEGLGLC